MALSVISTINLDMAHPNVNIVNAVQYDNSGKVVKANLYNNGEEWAVPANAYPVIRYQKSDRLGGFYDVDENGAYAIAFANNRKTIDITLALQMLTTVGNVSVQINFYDSVGHRLTTFAFIVRVQASVVPDNEIVSSEYYNALTKTIQTAVQGVNLVELVAEAEAAASNAEAEVLRNGTDLVSNWLAANMTNPSNPAIDKSLLVEDAAADARMTGDEIRSNGLSIMHSINSNPHLPLEYGERANFSSYSTVAAAATRVSMHRTSREGYLNKVYYKCSTATTVYVGIFKFVQVGTSEASGDNTLTLLALFPMAVTPDKTEYVFGVDFFDTVYVPENGTIGIKSTIPNTYYRPMTATDAQTASANWPSSGYPLVIGNTAPTGVRMSYDISVGMEVMSIYDGPTLRLPLSKDDICLESNKVVVKCTYNATGNSFINIRYHAGQSDQFQVQVRFNVNNITFYKPNSDEAYYSASLGFSTVVGHKYCITVERIDGNDMKLTVVDMYDTTLRFEYTLTQLLYHVGTGLSPVTTVQGNVTVDEIYMIAPEKTKIDLLILGDSYVQGYSLVSNSDRNQRWAYLVKQALVNKDVVICGKGGANAVDSVHWLNDYLLETYRPDYICFCFGMNDYSFNRNYQYNWYPEVQKFLVACKSIGAEPIFITIPPVSASAIVSNPNYATAHNEINNWIRNSGYMYVDVAKLLSLNHDGVTADDSLFLSDHLHPTTASHHKIADWFLMTIGES